MPIEVEGPDGTIAEFPDGTPNAVIKRAMSAKFGNPAPKPGKVALGKPAKAAINPTDAKSELDKASAILEEKIAGLPEKYKKQARGQFFADRRVTPLREASVAKATPRSAREQGRAQPPRTVVGEFLDEKLGGNFLKALSAGAGRAVFGLPERAAAAIMDPFTEGSHEETLETVRGQTDRELKASTTGNILGTLAGSTMGGGVAGAGVRKVGQVLSQGPGVVRGVGKALEGAATLRSGQRLKNAAKIVGGGSAAGTAQAAGEGTDVGTGAVVGAIGGAVVPPLIKLASFMSRPLRDFLGVSGSANILRRFTSTDEKKLSAAAEEYRKATGAEPTLFEIFPLADRNNIAKNVVGRSPGTQEQTVSAVQSRMANVGPELQARANEATQPGRGAIVGRMAQDLPSNPAPATINADRSPADMQAFQAQEAREIVGPHEGQVIADDLKELFPVTLSRDPDTGVVKEVFSDPEVVDAFNVAAGSLRLRPKVGTDTADIEGLNVADATKILRRLAGVSNNAPNKAAAMRAEAVLMEHMSERFPQASEAIGKMRKAYARRFRMLEGMAEGARGRTRESAPVEDAAQALKLRNAYESPEGAEGRFLGQANALQRDLGGTPQDALRTARNLSESGQTQEALSANLGPAAQDIVTAAEAQSRSVRNLSALSKEGSSVSEGLNVEDIGRMVLALNPASMPTTKLFAISRLASLTHIPEGQAKELVDMLFSQNPTITNRAINLLKRAGPQGNAALAQIGRGIAEELSPGLTEEVPEYPETYEEQNPAGTEVVEEGFEEVGDPEYGGYGEMLGSVMESEDPDFVDLWHRQTNQESQRAQFADDGSPLTSPKGAIGIAQVMPGTAPEAAELAGLEWDPEAYQNDPAYNELLGIAYMREMLEQFDGDIELALAAYNAGPNAVRKYGGVPPFKETQDYVRKILSGY